MGEPVTTSLHGSVAVISLNRPDQLNALSVAMLEALAAAFEDAGANDSARAVLLRAEGRAFCTGADLKEGFARAADTGETLRRYYHPVLEAMRRCPKPIVCAVQGLAAGAGCSLALAADLVIAGRSGGFQQIFSGIGLTPDMGSTHYLPRLVGRGRALGAMLTGEAVSAETAEHWGMVWELTEDDALQQRALALAESLGQRPTAALARTRALVDAAFDNTLADQLELEASSQSEMQRSADFGEAIQAFVQKRPPKFLGR